MTKEAFTSAAKYSIASNSKRYPEVIRALRSARALVTDRVLNKMTYQEQNQHLINIAWDIYQQNTGITESK
jgi:hypothetical protein